MAVTINVNNKDKTVVCTATATAAHTGTTAETYIWGAEVAAGTYTTGDRMMFELFASAVGTAGVKTIKIYFNTTNDISGTPVQVATYFTNQLSYSIARANFIDSTTSMKGFHLSTTNVPSWWASNSALFGTFAIDFTVTQYIVVSVQLASAADSFTLQGFYLERRRV